MQNNTVPMSKNKFRIGELSEKLKLKKFVIRFWEKEFGLESNRSGGGQRFYSQEDFKTFNTIKYLLYSQGFTIAGAKIKLNEMLKKNVVAELSGNIGIARKISESDEITTQSTPDRSNELLEKLSDFKSKLEKIKQSLE
jgi:DNA-binding transcriptional MerR regulator